MGSVELAFQPCRRRFCVIKRLLPGSQPSSLATDRLRREAAILARLQYPGIARLLSLELFNDALLLVQEFIHGRDLAQVLAVCASAGTRMPVSIAVQIVGQTAGALDHAYHHRRLGLVHRDLAPQNVMVSFDGEVKLVDFGVAKTAVDERLTLPGHLVGRPAYLAPEVLAGGPATHQADVYSLGLILWEALAGRPLATVRSASPRERPPASAFNRAVSPALDGIAQRAMAWRPEDRFETAGELEHALSAQSAPADGAGMRAFLALHYDLAREESLLAQDLKRACGLAGSEREERIGGDFPRRLALLLIAAAIALAGSFTCIAARGPFSHAKTVRPSRSPAGLHLKGELFRLEP